MLHTAPTLQLLIGVFIYNEAFPTERFLGFAWAALIVFTVEGLWQTQRSVARPAVK